MSLVVLLSYCVTAHESKLLAVRAPSSDYNNHMYPASEERQDAYQLSGA